MPDPILLEIWGKGLQPGQAWDAESPSPILVKYLVEGRVPQGRALVPGCGRGYDVTLLACTDRYVDGLEISPTAIQAAQERLEALPSPPPNSMLSFKLQSFFDLPNASDYDFIYDYTFLCALDPMLRTEWAKKMAFLIKPGGLLMTLIFPIWNLPEGFDVSLLPTPGPRPDTGPPYRVSLELLQDLLQPEGFQCEELRLLPPELCHKNRDGGGDGTRPYSGIGMWRRV